VTTDFPEQRFENALLASLSDASPEVRALIAPHLSPSGKRLRARLVFRAGAFGRAAGPNLTRAAVAIELLHAASLFHDDVIDDADERRGQPSVCRTHGARVATLVGAYLAHRSYNIIARLDGLPGEALQRVKWCFARAAADTCLGELKEGFNTDNSRITAAEYFDILEHKTARLFELACQLGALVTGGPAEALEAFGRAYGILFQVADDMRDVLCRADELGKPVGSDLSSGSYTLPVICGLQGDNGYGSVIRAVLLDAQGELPDADVGRVIDVLRSSAAVDHVLAEVSALAERATDAIAPLPRGEAYDALASMVDHLTSELARLCRRTDEVVVADV
jgi:geranylgeranyl pyrophosphate synthase